MTATLSSFIRSRRLHFLILVAGVLPYMACSGAEPLYQNPVLPGDHPDPSVIRLGNEFWATATSSEWGPQFPILHSADLVNWEETGPVFPHRPEWAVANFWAPEISQFDGKYFVYYVGRKRGGPLAVAVATADKPGGPYTDHGPLVSQPAGSIDPVPVAGENGKRYLIWKEDGNSRRLPTVLWVQPLSGDGLKLVGEPQEILRNDAPWEGAVIEGPFVVRRAEYFYLFYSGGGCCGRGCSYALGVARAKSLSGPWEKNPGNPIMAGNEQWKCPGHGSITDDGKGRFWLLYHSYSAKDFVYTGREGLLDEVKFSDGGWPQIDNGKGPSVVAPTPFGTAQNRLFEGKDVIGFVDRFEGKNLRAGWQWPQENEPGHETGIIQGRGLILKTSKPDETNLVAAIMARSTLTGDYEATTVVDNPKAGVAASLAAIGDEDNATGLAVHDGKLMLWRRDKGTQRILAEASAPAGSKVRLRLVAAEGHVYRFFARNEVQPWKEIGSPQSGEQMPPWDRSIRVGLSVGGIANAQAAFDEFRMSPRLK
jgi:xylan 1,4-beta-xylosidase